MPLIDRSGDVCASCEPWQLALRDVVSNGDELLELLGLATGTLGLDTCSSFPLRVPRSFVTRMRPGDPDDPLLRQVLPRRAESLTVPGFSTDPLAEAEARRVPGVIHKYRGRVLLIVAKHCGIHCRYCFRRHFPYAENQPSRAEWAQAFEYIRADASLHEVILSGGDPLSLSDRNLRWMVDAIEGIAHVRRLRIHSRLPVVIPQRITSALIGLLTRTRLQTSLVLHANHAQELDDAVANALQPLRSTAITLLNQSVLLAGVNDREDALADLCERLFAIGVLPYYVHQLDRVAGAAHFLVPDEQACALQQALLARLPGYLVPRFVREVPDAPSKVPIGRANAVSTAGCGPPPELPRT